MSSSNVVVLRGRLTAISEPRQLPSGGFVTQLDITTTVGDSSVSVPVVMHDRAVTIVVGTEVVVAGHVQRRFFRAGGSTQSRTEVLVADIVAVSRRRAVDKLMASAVSALTNSG